MLKNHGVKKNKTDIRLSAKILIKLLTKSLLGFQQKVMVHVKVIHKECTR